MSLLDTPKLGFGLMRLPTMPGEPDRIDIEQTKTMVDMFMEAGLTYFDTAFVYGKDGYEAALTNLKKKRHQTRSPKVLRKAQFEKERAERKRAVRENE